MSVWEPALYKAFRCLAGDCRHSCCRGWEIDVDEESAAYYRALPGRLGDDLRAALAQDEEGFHFRLTDGGRCPFLRPDGLCRLIRELGEDALCDICALHPRFFEELGEEELRGLGLSCEAVCALLTESAAPLRFVSDEGESLSFPALLDRLGIDPQGAPLRFTPDPSEARCAEILRRLSETPPGRRSCARCGPVCPILPKMRPITPPSVTAGATTASISISCFASWSCANRPVFRRWPTMRG